MNYKNLCDAKGITKSPMGSKGISYHSLLHWLMFGGSSEPSGPPIVKAVTNI